MGIYIIWRILWFSTATYVPCLMNLVRFRMLMVNNRFPKENYTDLTIIVFSNHCFLFINDIVQSFFLLQFSTFHLNPNILKQVHIEGWASIVKKLKCKLITIMQKHTSDTTQQQKTV